MHSNTIPRNSRGNLCPRRPATARDDDPMPFAWLIHGKKMLAENDRRRAGVKPELGFFYSEQK